MRVGQELDAPDGEFLYRWFSGTGKGGQHRNKHQNCLELTHVATGIEQSAHGRCRVSNETVAMEQIKAKIEAHYRSGNAAKVNSDRSGQIGSGMRGDKRRTYRFQDDSVVDHVTNRSSDCKSVMRGKLDALWA